MYAQTPVHSYVEIAYYVVDSSNMLSTVSYNVLNDDVADVLMCIKYMAVYIITLWSYIILLSLIACFYVVHTERFLTTDEYMSNETTDNVSSLSVSSPSFLPGRQAYVR